MASDDLASFLHDRLNEDEQAATATLTVNARAELINGHEPARWTYQHGKIWSTDRHDTLRVRHTWDREGEHITRHDPARVLRDVHAGRALLRMYEGAITAREHAQQYAEPYQRSRATAFMHALQAAVQFRALPYADHPDYRETWRP